MTSLFAEPSGHYPPKEMPTPEAHAREQIDAMLLVCGWVVQDFSALNLGLGRGIAFAKSCSSPGVATTCCS